MGKPDTRVLSDVKDEDLAAAVPSSPKASSRGVRLEDLDDDVESGVKESKSAKPTLNSEDKAKSAEKSMKALQVEVPGESVDSLTSNANKANGKLQKMGLMTALAIGIHNFPEGLATFVATLQDPSVGAALLSLLAFTTFLRVCVYPSRSTTQQDHGRRRWRGRFCLEYLSLLEHCLDISS